MISILIAKVFDILKKDSDNNMCKDLKRKMSKFDKNSSIYRSLLYDYDLFCKNKSKFRNSSKIV